MHYILRVVFRLAAWSIALAVALFPAHVASRSLPHTLNLFEFAGLLYAKGHFADFYFAGIIMSAFSLYNLWENIMAKLLLDKIERTTNTLRPSTAIAASLIFLLFLVFLVYGIATYMDYIQNDIIRSPGEVNFDVRVIIVVLFVSLGTEVLIAVSVKP